MRKGASALTKTYIDQEACRMPSGDFDKQYLLVPCLLLDKIMIFDHLHDDQLVKEIDFPKGSGPRHGVMDTNNHLYLVSELSNQLFIFHLDEELHMELLKTIDLVTGKKKKRLRQPFV